MEILVMCPANFASGGPETLHKLVSDLNAFEGVDAKLLYVSKNLSNPQPEAYKDYRAPYIVEFPQGFNGVIILPEIWANAVNDSKYAACTKAIYWLSVDNYKQRIPKSAEGLCIEDDNVLHIVQSFYVEEYVRGLGAKKVFKLIEPVNEEFFKPYESVERSNVILYNPSKMTDFQRGFMGWATTHKKLTFEPLQGLTIQQMAQKLRTHKLYIDFGPFPGRERIPREAVLCGCCIVTGTNGASRYFKDISILNRYKFNTNIAVYEEASNIIQHILDNYEECVHDYDFFKTVLIQEKASLPEQLNKLVEVLKCGSV